MEIDNKLTLCITIDENEKSNKLVIIDGQQNLDRC